MGFSHHHPEGTAREDSKVARTHSQQVTAIHGAPNHLPTSTWGWPGSKREQLTAPALLPGPSQAPDATRCPMGEAQPSARRDGGGLRESPRASQRRVLGQGMGAQGL